MPCGKRRLFYKRFFKIHLSLGHSSFTSQELVMDHFLWWSAPRTRARTQAPLPHRAGSVLFLPRALPSRLAPPTFLLAPPSSFLQPESTEALAFRAPAHCACAASGRLTFPEVGGTRSSLCGRRRGNASPVIFQRRKARLSGLAG